MKFTMVISVPEDFICIICRNLLINAFQRTCGCDYCYRCIVDYSKTGATSCPGHSDECQMANLSDIVPDHRMNKQINQLIVKCSEETCSYEWQLAKIDEHLRLCPKKSVKCPFYEFGCNHEGRSQERFCTESNDHNNILIDTIGNLKNEIIDLKNITQKSNFEIENLNDNLTRKNAKIESLEAKMKLIEVKPRVWIKIFNIAFISKRMLCNLRFKGWWGFSMINLITKWDKKRLRHSMRLRVLEKSNFSRMGNN